MVPTKLSVYSRLKSVKYAIFGLKILFKDEPNAQIHLYTAVLVMGLGFALKISGLEWVALFIVIGFVFALEIVNTAIERIANFISPQKNQEIKAIKDLAAAAVLIAALAAVGVGTIIFIPKILNLFILTNG
jgi:diacylglycerol kinase